MKKITLRELLEKTVFGLKQDFYSEKERKQLVDWLFKWSTIELTDVLILS